VCGNEYPKKNNYKKRNGRNNENFRSLILTDWRQIKIFLCVYFYPMSSCYNDFVVVLHAMVNFNHSDPRLCFSLCAWAVILELHIYYHISWFISFIYINLKIKTEKIIKIIQFLKLKILLSCLIPNYHKIKQRQGPCNYPIS